MGRGGGVGGVMDTGEVVWRGIGQGWGVEGGGQWR